MHHHVEVGILWDVLKTFLESMEPQTWHSHKKKIKFVCAGLQHLLTQLFRNDIIIINSYFVLKLYLLRGHKLAFCGHELVFCAHVIAILWPQLNFFWPCHVWGSIRIKHVFKTVIILSHWCYTVQTQVTSFSILQIIVPSTWFWGCYFRIKSYVMLH